MTQKETIRFLQSYLESCAKIDNREKDLEEWEKRYRKNLSFGVLMPMSLIMCDIKAEVEQAARKRDEVKAAVEEVQDGRIRTVLDGRYLAGKSYRRIAKEMNYTERRVLQLHQKGIIEIREKYK